jgi:hypothetical protein
MQKRTVDRLDARDLSTSHPAPSEDPTIGELAAAPGWKGSPRGRRPPGRASTTRVIEDQHVRMLVAEIA